MLWYYPTILDFNYHRYSINTKPSVDLVIRITTSLSDKNYLLITSRS